MITFNQLVNDLVLRSECGRYELTKLWVDQSETKGEGEGWWMYFAWHAPCVPARRYLPSGPSKGEAMRACFEHESGKTGGRQAERGANY